MISQLVLTLAAVSALILASGYFSGMEIGLYALNRVRHRIRLSQEDARARTVQTFLDRPERFISTVLVGNNIVNATMTALVTFFFVRWLQGSSNLASVVSGGLSSAGVGSSLLTVGPRAELLTTLCISPLIFMLGEVAPKDLFRRQADWLVYRLGPFTSLVTLALRPLSWPLEIASRGIQQRLLPRHKDMEPAGGADFLVHVLASGAEAGVLTDYQDRMARNVVALRGRRLADVMIPSRDVVAVSAASSTEAAQEVARKRGVTRMPLFDRHHHDWLGIVDIFDLWPRDEQDTSLRERCRDVPRLSPNLTVEIAIGRIRRSRQPMAFVVQGSRCLGLVTLKDLVEEIVGELQDL